MSNQDIRLIQLNNYVRPSLEENKFQDWVLNGKKNSFYQYIIDRNNGSPTNSAINNAYIDLIIGRGLYDKNDSKDFDRLMEVFSKDTFRKVATDLQLFNEFSNQIVHKRNRKEIPVIEHIAKNKVVPQVEDEDGMIKGYWYSKDWTNTYKNKPVYYPAFGTSKEAIELSVIKPYKAGKDYFPDPDYLAGLPYAEMEEEISNLYINSIKNGLSAGYIINIPDGINLSPEEKDELERKIKKKLTGSPNASRFILSFNGRDAEITIIPIPQNENVHKQWSYLTEEAKQQICTSHRLISTSLVGINNSSGFSSTSDEMDEAESQLIKRVIQPKQRYIIDFLQEFASVYGLDVELGILPLTEQEDVTEETIKEEVETDEIEDVEMSKQCACNDEVDTIADDLIQLGEDVNDEEWELLEERAIDTPTLTEESLNNIVQFAKAPTNNTSRKSKQDTSLFLIRYKYAGNPTPERDFCKKVMNANKFYRVEDLENASNMVVNAGFGVNGSDTYDIFLYKGGVNCKHFWERKIFLKKNSQQISVNQARKLILELEPKDRKRAKWEQNPKEVAKIADDSNNHWRVN